MEGTCNQCVFPVKNPPKFPTYYRGSTSLMYAASRGYVQCVKELIAAGADVNQAENNGSTPLVWAAAGNQITCLKELIESGADVNMADRNGHTALVYAAFCGFKECISTLLNARGDVNAADKNGETALFHTARKGQFTATQLLIQSGANVNHISNHKRTALMRAAGKGQKKCVTELIRAGADVNIADENNAVAPHYAAYNDEVECLAEVLTTLNINHTNSNGLTALSSACQRGLPKCVDLLLKAGADVNILTENGNTALTAAAVAGHPKCLQLLIDAEADVNVIVQHISTALMKAAIWDHLECVKLLLTAGADVNFATSEWSAIHLAAANANHICVDVLLSAGADVNKTTRSILVVSLDYTIKQCIMAFKEMKEKYILENHSHSTCVKLLIKAGADVNMAENKGFTPLINAARNGHDDCIDLLIQAGASVNQAAVSSITPIIGAAIHWTPNCLQKLISAGADVNAVRYRDEERIALMECVWDSQKWHEGDIGSDIEWKSKQKECMEIFINAGANVNAKADGGITTLMKASGNGYEECVKLLLKAGADVNVAYRDGCTPLIYSAMFGREICTNDLLAAGADVNAYCKKGRIPLIYSAVYGHDTCLGPIITAGADLNRKDDLGLTALMHAAWFGNFKCVEALLRAGADVNSKEEKWGSTALILASEYNECNCASFYDEYNFTIDKTKNVFVPEDHNASKCVEALIKAGADVNVVDNEDKAVLIRAVENRGNNILVIKHLLKANCHINIVRYTRLNALASHVLYGCTQPRDISMLLFAAGEMVDYFEGFINERLQNILKLEDPGIQLKHICREAIRKHLLDLDPHQHLFARVPRLGLPELLNLYLLYGESLDDDNVHNCDVVGKKSSSN